MKDAKFNELLLRGELGEVVSGADQQSFVSSLVDAAEEKLTEAAGGLECALAGAGQLRRPGVAPDLRQRDAHRPVGYARGGRLLPLHRGAKVLGGAIRAHWGIENRAHYVRDVTLGEDASRIRTKPGIMARIRSVALNVLRANGVQNVSLALYVGAVSFDQLLAFGSA